MQCWPGETDDEWEEDLPDNIRLFDGVGFYIRSIVYYIVDCVYTEIDAKKNVCAQTQRDARAVARPSRSEPKLPRKVVDSSERRSVRRCKKIHGR